MAIYLDVSHLEIAQRKLRNRLKSSCENFNSTLPELSSAFPVSCESTTIRKTLRMTFVGRSDATAHENAGG